METGKRSCVLLVDGDLGRRATLAVALGARYTVDTATGVDDTLRHAARTVFDLAVLDAAALLRGLPRVVRILRRRAPAIRLVVVTARRDLRGRHYAAMLGVDATLPRPTAARALIERVDALLATAGAWALPRGGGGAGGAAPRPRPAPPPPPVRRAACDILPRP